VFPAPRVRLSPIVLPIQLHRRTFSRPTFLLAAGYKSEPSLESRLQIEVVRTPFLTESRYPIAHLWRGVHLNVFDNSFHSQGLQLGSSLSGIGFQDFRPSSHDQAGIGNSDVLDGISLRYSFGRDAETRNPVQIWRCLAWIMGNGRGCPL